MLPLLAGVPGYTIHTIAGSDNVGDGGPATAAFISILEGVCMDGSGNVYVADADDNRIRKIDTAGTITTYAGTGSAGFSGDGGPADKATLRNPYGIRMDGNGNLFIADLGNNRVRRVGSDGTISTLLSGLNQPRNLGFDAVGRLYFGEFGGNRVSRLESDGTSHVIAGSGVGGLAGDGGPATSAQLNGPAAIAFDVIGNLYIADSGNRLIRKVTADGTISTFWGSGPTAPLSEPTGVATDAQGNVYVAQTGFPTVFRVDSSSVEHRMAGIGRDLFVSPNGDLLVVGDQHLEFVHTDGSLSSLFAQSPFTFGDGGPATAGRLESVSGVAVDASGDVIIADAAFHRLRIVSPGGLLESLPASDSVTSPHALAFDNSGRLFIADGTAIRMENGGDPVVDVVTGLNSSIRSL